VILGTLLIRESRSIALAVGALAEVDVGPVCPVLMPAVPAAQYVDVLEVICAGEIRTPNYDLPVAVPVAWLGRPFAHSVQYTRTGSRNLSLGSFKATLNVVQTNALSFLTPSSPAFGSLETNPCTPAELCIRRLDSLAVHWRMLQSCKRMGKSVSKLYPKRVRKRMGTPAGFEDARQPHAPRGTRPEAVRIWLFGDFRVSVGSRNGQGPTRTTLG
jgi:hypothetical protein